MMTIKRLLAGLLVLLAAQTVLLWHGLYVFPYEDVEYEEYWDDEGEGEVTYV